MRWELIEWIVFIETLMKGVVASSSLRALGKAIEVTMKYDSYKLLIPLNIGEPKQTLDVLYDTSSFHIWMYNFTFEQMFIKSFDPSLSKTYEQTQNPIVLNTNIVKCNAILDLVYFGSRNDQKFNLLLVNKIIPGIATSGVIGLAMKYPGQIKINNLQSIDANPKYSLIHQLFNVGLIDKKVFAHKFISPTEAVLYLGSSGTSNSAYPKCFSNNRNISQVLLTSKTDYSWRCDFEGFSFGHNLGYDLDFNQSTVFFYSDQNYLTVPYNLTSSIFTLLIKLFNASCITRFVPLKGLAVVCDQNLDSSKVPDMRLRIKGMEMVIKAEDLFEPHYFEHRGKDYFGYLARIFGDFYHRNSFIIGTIGMKYYHMVFDMEEESVGLVERIAIFDDIRNIDFKKDRSLVHNDSGKGRTMTIGAGIILLIIACGIIILLRRYKLKRGKGKRRGEQGSTCQIAPIEQPMIAK